MSLMIVFHIIQCEIKAYTFKITRDAELDVDDDISKSFIEKMRDSIEMRKLGETVRFVYDSSMPIDLLRYLMYSLKLEAGVIRLAAMRLANCGTLRARH